MTALEEAAHPHRIHVAPVTTTTDLEAVYAIRDEVFHHEQQLTRFVRDDPDDQFSLNVLATVDGVPVGTGRVTLFGDEAQIAWVAVRKPYRQLGVGRAIMVFLIDWSRQQGARYVTLNAQTHALEFYRKLGFVPVGRRFFMAHIEHQMMVLTLTNQEEPENGVA